MSARAMELDPMNAGFGTIFSQMYVCSAWLKENAV